MEYNTQKQEESKLITQQTEQFLKNGGIIKSLNAHDRNADDHFRVEFVNSKKAKTKGIKYDKFRYDD